MVELSFHYRRESDILADDLYVRQMTRSYGSPILLRYRTKIMGTYVISNEKRIIDPEYEGYKEYPFKDRPGKILVIKFLTKVRTKSSSFNLFIPNHQLILRHQL